MIPAEMAAHLRGLGWAVTEPPTSEIPMPRVGQVWASPNLKIKPRTVTALDPAGTTLMRFSVDGSERWWNSRSKFVEWARQHHARPQTQNDPGQPHEGPTGAA